MAKVTLKNIEKVYENGFHAVKNLDLDIEDKEFMVLVGPSGCGKTTTLRMIAGLEENNYGELYIGDTLVNDVEPKNRNIAMVFQNYALYPHMTVYDNMAFGLKIQKTPKEEIRQRIEKSAKILDIEHLLKRRPKQLSGGQRQRVALGRAIVRKPGVFLMDEPLSNLDAKLRVQMRAELIKLHNELQTTFIYVTHDQTEAMTMGSRICVMHEGVLQQVADPKTIYNHPANLFVASFIGSPPMNFMEGQLVERQGSIFAVIHGHEIELHEEAYRKVKEKGYGGKDVIVGIRPEGVNLVSEREGMPAKAQVSELLGSNLHVYFTIGEKQHILSTSPKMEVDFEETIYVSFDHKELHFFDKDTEESILV